MTPKTFMAILLGISTTLSVCAFIAPFLSPNGSFLDLDGTVGVMDHSSLWSEQDPFTCAVYSLGDILCHQEEARTIILNGSEMPICIRDVGLLLGLTVGSLVCLTERGKVFVRRFGVIHIIVSFALIFIDWLIQHTFDLNVPSARLATGLLAGAGFAFLIYIWLIRTFGTEE